MDSNFSLLRNKGYRMTPQRRAILRILQESGRHLTPIEVFQTVQQELPGITEATVYRTLTFLTAQGLALAAHVGSGQLVYELAGHDHHHLVCRACGHTHEVDHTALCDLYQDLYKLSGYKIDTVHVTFFGLCPACQEN